MAELEDLIRSDKAVQATGANMEMRAQAGFRVKRQKTELFRLLGSLTAEQIQEYGEYRKTELF